MGALWAPIIGRDFFFLFVVARPPFGLPAPIMHPTGAYGYPYGVPIIMGHPVGAPYVHPVGAHLRHDNGAPCGCPICAPLRGAHYFFLFVVARPPFGLPAPIMHPTGAYGYPYGVPIIMGHPVGAPYVHPVGAHYLFFFS